MIYHEYLLNIIEDLMVNEDVHNERLDGEMGSFSVEYDASLYATPSIGGIKLEHLHFSLSSLRKEV